MHIMRTDDTVTVTAAEFHRNIGTYQDMALTKAVNITKNGRSRTVLISAEEYARLKRRDRRVIETGELSERQVAALREARLPEQYSDLDRELKDWKP
jgi:PHD/YefM family antitoxin component YafN of YafNO toxin-antitoxin module